MIKMICAALVLLCASSCNTGSNVALEGTTWKLATMPGIPAEAITAEADAFVMEFNASEQLVAGRTNCNRFFGRYELKGHELEFENIGMTRMACPDMQFEDLFVKMLDEVDRYKIKGKELMLLDDKQVIATFVAQSTVVSEAKGAIPVQ